MKKALSLLAALSIILMMIVPTLAVSAASVYSADSGYIAATTDWTYSGLTYDATNGFGDKAAGSYVEFQVDFGSTGYNTIEVSGAEMHASWKWQVFIDGSSQGYAMGNANGQGWHASVADIGTVLLSQAYTGVHTVKLVCVDGGNIHGVEFVNTDIPCYNAADGKIDANADWISSGCQWDASGQSYGWINQGASFTFQVDFGSVSYNTFRVYAAEAHEGFSYKLYIDGEEVGVASGPNAGTWNASDAKVGAQYIKKAYTGKHLIKLEVAPNENGNYKGNMCGFELINTPEKVAAYEVAIPSDTDWTGSASFEAAAGCFGSFGTYEKMATVLVNFGNLNVKSLLVSLGHPHYPGAAKVYVDDVEIGSMTAPCSGSYEAGINGYIDLPTALNGIHTISISTDNANLFSITPHAHDYYRNECTEEGVCSCGAIEASAPGHSWKPATCTEPKTCSVCGVTEGAALGHTSVKDAAVAATCTTTGLTAGSHCSVCGEILEAQRTVGMIEHTYVNGTCINCGATTNIPSGTVVKTYTSGKITYTVSDLGDGSYSLVVSGTGAMAAWSGMSTYSANIKYIVIGEGITSIAYGQFKGLAALEQVVLPSTLTTINGAAFQNCKNLAKVNLPEGLTTLNYAAFLGTGLTSVIIPNSLVNMGKNVFQNCKSLTTVTFGASKLAKKTLPARTFSGCTALKTVDFGTVLQIIDDYAFNQCGIEELYLPANIKTVDNAAFYKSTSLKKVELAGATYLGWASFYSCPALTDIDLGPSLKTISTWVFTACSNLKEIDIPNTVTNIGRRTFSWCSRLETVDLSTGMTEIKDELFFSNSKLVNVNIPDTITKIGAKAFYKCLALETVDLPASVTTIGTSAFTNSAAIDLVYVNSDTIASGLTKAAAYGDLIKNANSVAIRHGLLPSSFVVKNYTNCSRTTIDGVTYTVFSKEALPGVEGVNYNAGYQYNVKNYGAKGDGSTDDTMDIQFLLNELNAGDTVYFPAGIYMISDPLRIPEGVHLIGEPATNGVGGSMIKADWDMDCVIGALNGTLRKSTIMNLTLDGGRTSGYDVGAIIDAPEFASNRFANLKLQNCTGNGIYTYSNNEDNAVWIATIENIEVTGVVGWAMYMINSDSAFNHITVDGGKGIMDYAFGGNVYNDIHVSNSTGSGLTLGRDTVNESGMISIINSTFNNNAQYGLQMNCPSAQDKRVAVEGCDFYGNGMGDVSVASAHKGSFVNCNFRSGTPFANASSARQMTIINSNFAAGSFSATGFDVNTSNNKFGVTSFTDKGIALNVNDYNYGAIYGAAALQSTSGDVVNVVDFGATNKASVDSSVAFQAAIDAVAAKGGVVYVPKGTYGFAKTVKVPSNVAIVAAGNNGTVNYAPFSGLKTIFQVEDGARNVVFLNGNIVNPNGTAVNSLIKGNNIADCQFDGIEGDSNVVSNYSNVLYLSNSNNCDFNAIVCGVGNGGTIINLKNSTNCAIQSSYISRGSKGTIVDGGSGHVIFNNHYDWFYVTAIEFLNGANNCLFTNNYCDINQRVVMFNYDTVTEANITLSASLARDSGIPANNALISGGSDKREIPEIFIKNAKNVTIQGFHSDIWPTRGRTTDALIDAEGTNSVIGVYACLYGSMIRNGSLGENSNWNWNVDTY